MKRKSNRSSEARLALRKELLRRLDPKQLAAVGAGDEYLPDCTCIVNCSRIVSKPI